MPRRTRFRSCESRVLEAHIQSDTAVPRHRVPHRNCPIHTGPLTCGRILGNHGIEVMFLVHLQGRAENFPEVNPVGSVQRQVSILWMVLVKEGPTTAPQRLVWFV
jgi:hypothetical protein